MIIRRAGVLDAERLRQLMRFLVAESGSEIVDSEKTRDFFDHVVADCVGGGGVAVVAEGQGSIVGCSLARVQELGFDTKFGRVAFGWGTYVMPGHRGSGVAFNLRDALCKGLSDMGIETLLGSVAPDNGSAFSSAQHSGFVAYGVNGYRRLK